MLAPGPLAGRGLGCVAIVFHPAGVGAPPAPPVRRRRREEPVAGSLCRPRPSLAQLAGLPHPPSGSAAAVTD